MFRPLIYKLNTDNKGAPCVTDDLLSLAICKPGYLTQARQGDVLLGFMGRTAAGGTEPLVYIAEITEEPLPILEYYTKALFKNRPDCIYKYVGNEFKIRRNAAYHNYLNGLPDVRNKDLGVERNAFVQVSRNFRYLGDRRIILTVNQHPELTRLVHSLTRTNYPRDLTKSSVICESAPY
jgi:hypothetical protein